MMTKGWGRCVNSPSQEDATNIKLRKRIEQISIMYCCCDLTEIDQNPTLNYLLFLVVAVESGAAHGMRSIVWWMPCPSYMLLLSSQSM
jgi:hypothetical protein